MSSKRFEARDLPERAEFVESRDLRKGAVYFRVSFVDDDGVVPLLEPLVFIGRDLEEPGEGRVYFQDGGSFLAGERAYSEDGQQEENGVSSAVAYAFPENAGCVYEYERALEALMRCSLRRAETATTQE